MKTVFLAALALPLLLTGCGTYVGYDGGYGPGYGPAYGPDYYDGVNGDVAVFGYDRGGYQPHYHHYDGSSHNSSAVASHSFAHSTRVANAGHVSGGHSGGGGGASHASASVGHH
jgi:hypothetical protein